MLSLFQLETLMTRKKNKGWRFDLLLLLLVVVDTIIYWQDDLRTHDIAPKHVKITSVFKLRRHNSYYYYPQTLSSTANNLNERIEGGVEG